MSSQYNPIEVMMNGVVFREVSLSAEGLMPGDPVIVDTEGMVSLYPLYEPPVEHPPVYPEVVVSTDTMKSCTCKFDPGSLEILGMHGKRESLEIRFGSKRHFAPKKRRKRLCKKIRKLTTVIRMHDVLVESFVRMLDYYTVTFSFQYKPEIAGFVV